MRFRNTAILAAIVALVGAYLYFVERPAVEREAAKKTLLEFNPEDVRIVVLEYPGRSIRLARRDGTWAITEPRELEADPTTVENLLRATAEAELKRVVDETPADLAKFGLDPPAATIRIELADGTALPAIAVGGSTPIGFNAYARRGEEPAVLLTSGAFQSGVKKDLEDLRDKTIVRFEDAKVTKLTLRRNGEAPIVLARAEQGWRLEAPVDARADAITVQSMLGSLRAMRARGFADDPSEDAASAPADGEATARAPADRGLTAPQLTVELSLEGGGAEAIEFGAAKPGEGESLIYVRRRGTETVYEVGSHVLANLSKTPDELRDKTVVSLDIAAVQSLTVERSDGQGFTLERDGESWRVTGADAATRSSVAERLVEDAVQIRGSRVAATREQLTEFGLDKPDLRILLRSDEGDLATIRLSSKDEAFFAFTDDATAIFEIPDYVYRRFDKRRTDLLEEPPTPSPQKIIEPAGVASPDAEAPAPSAAS